MPVVFACAASHAPGMTAWTEAAPKEQADRFLGCYRKLGEMLAALEARCLGRDHRRALGEFLS
jgi:hypothetical protein